MDPKEVQISGHVTKGVVAKGSKSEHDAVTLQGLDGSSYILRKQGAPSFGDNSLDALVGRRLTARGLAVGDTLIMKSWSTDE